MSLPIQYPIAAKGKTLRVMQWGLEGPPVVLVHGLGSRSELWRPFAELVSAQGYRCLAIDTPGHGLSWKGGDFDYSAAGHAALLESAFDALGEQKVHLVASSLGGLHAAATAVSVPDRLHSLTMIGSIGLKAMTPERCEWTASYLSDMSREAITQRYARSVFDPSLFTPAYIEETFWVNNSPGAAEAWAAIAAYYRGGINDDIQTEALAALKGRLPLLLLWGRDDPTVLYEAGLEAVARIPGAVLAGIANTKHMPQLERPALSARQVLRLIRQDPDFALPEAEAGAQPDLEIVTYPGAG